MFLRIQKQMKRRKGFTLIELMIVVAILGILATVAIPKFNGATASANQGKVLADLSAIDTAISMYSAAHNGVLTSLTSSTIVSEGFLISFPTPPAGTTFSTGGTATSYVIDVATTSATYGRATFNGYPLEKLVK